MLIADCLHLWLRYPLPMDVISLTRKLVDIESITGHENHIATYLLDELHRRGFDSHRMPVESGRRDNIIAISPSHPEPEIFLSTHMDTVPPFIPSSEDETRIFGRGACDAKGIIASQIAAAERLRTENIHVGLLFLVGEERDSLGAKIANQHARGSRFLINGEPTDN